MLNNNILIEILSEYDKGKVNCINLVLMDKSVDDGDIINILYDEYKMNYIPLDVYQQRVLEKRNNKINNLLNE